MIYNININQVKSVEYWLKLEQATILSVFLLLPSWWKSIVVDNINYYYLSVWKILDEVPVLWVWTSRIRQIISHLKDEWFLEWKFVKNKSYYSLTDKSKSFILSWQSVDKNITIKTTPVKKTLKTKPNKLFEDKFDEFWELFPKNFWNKKTSKTRYLKLLKDWNENTHQLITDALKVQIKAHTGSFKYFKIANNWLKEDCWLDEIDSSDVLDIANYESFTKDDFIKYCNDNYPNGNYSLLPEKARHRYQSLA